MASPRHRCHQLTLPALMLLVLSTLWLSTPAVAQEYDLFARWQIDLGASFMAFDTTVRLDSALLGRGTEIDFENDLGLDSDKVIPQLRLAYQSRTGAHRFGMAYFKADRAATHQVSTEIRFGDVVVPIDEVVGIGFDWQQITVDYTWFFIHRDRHMLGAWAGFRWIDVTATLEVLGLEVREQGTADGPLPFIGLEYRLGMTPKTRLVFMAGLFEADIDDIEGATGGGEVAFEYVPWDNFGFLAGYSYSYAKARTAQDDLAELEIESDMGTLRLGARIRF